MTRRDRPPGGGHSASPQPTLETRRPPEAGNACEGGRVGGFALEPQKAKQPFPQTSSRQEIDSFSINIASVCCWRSGVVGRDVLLARLVYVRLFRVQICTDYLRKTPIGPSFQNTPLFPSLSNILQLLLCLNVNSGESLARTLKICRIYTYKLLNDR